MLQTVLDQQEKMIKQVKGYSENFIDLQNIMQIGYKFLYRS